MMMAMFDVFDVDDTFQRELYHAVWMAHKAVFRAMERSTASAASSSFVSTTITATLNLPQSNFSTTTATTNGVC